MTGQGIDDPSVRQQLPAELRLGHDVARNLAHLPHDEAVSAVGEHLRLFWDPRMRRAIIGHVCTGDVRVDPLLAEAVRRHLMP